MSINWCEILSADPLEYRGATPGPMGVGDASDPARSSGTGDLPGRTPGTLGVNDSACALASGPLVLPLSENGCSEMSPHEFMQLYRELEVPYAARASGQRCGARADVHVYVNAKIPRRNSNPNERSALQDQVRRSLRSPATAPIASVRAHHLAIAHVFCPGRTVEIPGLSCLRPGRGGVACELL